MASNILRKEAYQYILFLLGNLPGITDDSDSRHFIPLEELRLLKEGLADPSPALVTLLRELMKGSVSDADIDSHLVTPFQNSQPE